MTKMCELCGDDDHTTFDHRQGIKMSDALFPMVTENYVDEPWHHDELQLASKHGIPLVAIVDAGIDFTEYEQYDWLAVIRADDVGDGVTLEDIADDPRLTAQLKDEMTAALEATDLDPTDMELIRL